LDFVVISPAGAHSNLLTLSGDAGNAVFFGDFAGVIPITLASGSILFGGGSAISSIGQGNLYLHAGSIFTPGTSGSNTGNIVFGPDATYPRIINSGLDVLTFSLPNQGRALQLATANVNFSYFSLLHNRMRVSVVVRLLVDGHMFTQPTVRFKLQTFETSVLMVR
jgi:hypothetical protein